MTITHDDFKKAEELFNHVGDVCTPYCDDCHKSIHRIAKVLEEERRTVLNYVLHTLGKSLTYHGYTDVQAPECDLLKKLIIKFEAYRSEVEK